MSEERTVVKLEPQQEWRFEVAFDAKLNVRLISGSAELFGTESAKGRDYEFAGKHAAIFTYHGCQLEWEGQCSEYVAENSVMKRYVSIHFALESMRRKSEKIESSEQISEQKDKTGEGSNKPPVTLILGDANSGKTTLAKILVSYATKMGRFPVLVNLDPTAAAFSPPGSLVAVPISHILDIEDSNFGQPAISGPAQTHHKQPIVFNYGLPEINQSPQFYLTLISRLAEVTNARVSEDERVRNSGIIIDTPSSLSLDENAENNLDIIRQTVKDFGINSMLVIGKERLAVKLQREFYDDNTITIINVPQSGGVTKDDEAFIRQMQRRAITEYFFGANRQALSPFTITSSLKDSVVYRPIERNDMDTGEESLLTEVEPSAVLQNCVLAYVNADSNAPPAEIAQAETLGYVQITEADDVKQLAKILSTSAGSLPRKAFIMGTYRYHE